MADTDRPIEHKIDKAIEQMRRMHETAKGMMETRPEPSAAPRTTDVQPPKR